MMADWDRRAHLAAVMGDEDVGTLDKRRETLHVVNDDLPY